MILNKKKKKMVKELMREFKMQKCFAKIIAFKKN